MEKEVLEKYNYLTTLRKESYNVNQKSWNWLFRCECGNEKVINIAQVRNGSTKSCGCLKMKNLKHGTGTSHNNWKGKTPISATYINCVKKRSILKNLEYKLTESFLWNLFNKQKGLCALSGLKLSIDNIDFTASIDRINSKIGYIKNNVQWVYKDINYMKYNLTEDDFFNICNKINNKHGKK